MNDATPAGDGPISTQPEGNPDLDVPGDSPFADTPMPEAPDLAPDSTEPAEPTGDATLPTDDATTDVEAPPLPGEADSAWSDEAQSGAALADEGPAADEPTTEVPPAEPLPALADTRPEPRRLSRGEREMVDRTRQRFAACGRCGYLIADLQLLLGEEALQTAALAARDGWLRLDGDEQLRTLLNNAFGVRLDVDYDGMDGSCPECRRRFVFASLDDGRARLKLRT